MNQASGIATRSSGAASVPTRLRGLPPGEKQRGVNTGETTLSTGGDVDIPQMTVWRIFTLTRRRQVLEPYRRAYSAPGYLRDG